jgi:MFS family permease
MDEARAKRLTLIACIVGGALGDLYGRRRIFAIGTAASARRR